MTKKKTKPEAKAESTELALQLEQEILRIQKAFTAGPLFRDAPGAATPGIQVATWSVLDEMGKLIEERKAAYRDQLLITAEQEGSKTDKGGYKIWIDSSEVVRENRQDKLPNEDLLKQELILAKIDIKECFDEVKTLKLNPSKLNYLIETGKLSQARIDEMRKKSVAMKVNKSEVLKESLNRMVSSLQGESPGQNFLKKP